ncbi:MAG: hypothetical protein ACI9XO_002561 [Paraglaciecola sp.]|jgi:hypothetical protein
MNIIKIYFFLFLFATLSACSSKNKEQATTAEPTSIEKPATTISKNPNKSLYWGDTHLHTTNSPDAFSFGARLTPDDALRFAKGQMVESEGLEMKLERPLDFLVVADHAEGLGLINEIMKENPLLMKDDLLKKWSKELQAGGEKASGVGQELINTFAAGKLPKVLTDRVVMKNVIGKIWSDYLKTTEQHNEPGKFTAFAGYEWSALPQGNNLHRIVIYRDGMEQTIQTLPFSSVQSNDPEDLWKALQRYEDKTGGKVLAIPHNGNVSNGLMFTLTDFVGNPMTKEYAALRSRWEPLVEATQIKGDSEAHPFLSPNDEFASYGIAGWDLGNLNLSITKKEEMLQYEYTREALKNGLLLEEQLGVNPYDFGMIGSTDAHTAMATADSDNFAGKFTNMVADKERAIRVEEIGESNSTGDAQRRFKWQYLASGYAAVWAENNTREALWDAMRRKEVYGTTGPRIQLRFFGGWDFKNEDIEAADYASIGYQKGVPMGSDLLKNESAKAPTFMIAATKDGEGANLDRVQVIKGWTKDGKIFEKIYDVSWSGDRTIDAKGKLPAVGNSVNIQAATYQNSIGEPELTTVWTDPEFDPSIRAFYYVRVLEIPTPRWSTYDAARHNFELPANVPRTVQERAYSSPIWYSPK